MKSIPEKPNATGEILSEFPEKSSLPQNAMPSEKTRIREKPSLLRPILLIAAVIAAMILFRYWGIGERLDDLKGWIRGLGPLGPVAFVALYIISVVAALPGLAATLLAAALFGSFLGVILVSIGSTMGAALAFLIARYIARKSVAQRLAGHKTFEKLDLMTKEHGAIMVAITRLVPLFPFNLLNYAFGLTSVPFGTYLLWSWLCMLPATILYVVGVDALVTGLSDGKVPWPLVAIVVVAALILIFLVREAKKRLKVGKGKSDAAA